MRRSSCPLECQVSPRDLCSRPAGATYPVTAPAPLDVPAWGGEGACDTHMGHAHGHTGTCMLTLTQLGETVARPQHHLWSFLKDVPFLKTEQNKASAFSA